MKKTTTKKEPSNKKAPTKKVEKEVIKGRDVKEVFLKEFSVTAIIPTMMYGNIQPTITVDAMDIESAKSFVLPVIEELYNKYAETPQGGNLPRFISGPKVEVKEKMVVQKLKEGVVKTPLELTKELEVAQSESDAFVQDLEHSPAFTKAENAIKNSMTLSALSMIEDQIKVSVKLKADEKEVLLGTILKKRREL